MEEKNGLKTVIEVLGERIIDLERSVSCERYLKEENERRVSELEKENYALRERLNAVHMYVERMEEA